MSTRRILLRRLAAGLSLGAVLSVSLCGCFPGDPAPPTGVRLNSDGSVDMVSCVALSNVTKLEGTTYRRHGWNGVIDDKTKVTLTVGSPQVRKIAIGERVRFSGIPANWDSMYLDALGGTEAAVQNGELKVGQWTWYGEVNPPHCLAGKPY